MERTNEKPGSSRGGTEKQAWAQQLYTKERLSIKEIALQTDTEEAAIRLWVQQYNWENLRNSLMITKEEQLRRMYEQLDWLTITIAQRDIPVADSKEADVINKLTTAIKALETETSLAEIIDVGKEFLLFISTVCNTEKNKEIVLLYDAFVQATLSGKRYNS